MPTRLIRDGILSSARINALSVGAELLYRRLMSVVDDFGCFYAAPATIRGACWPTCPYKVSEREVGKWLAECGSGDRSLIVFYEVDGVQYLRLSDFGQQVRTKSKFPQPENNLLSGCQQNVHASRSRSRNAETKAESYAEPEPGAVAPPAENPPPITPPVPASKLAVMPRLPAEWQNSAAFVRAWERHGKNRGKTETYATVAQVLIGTDSLDWDALEVRHVAFCEYWTRKGWDYCALTFLEWIQNGMPLPPPEPKAREDTPMRQTREQQRREALMRD